MRFMAIIMGFITFLVGSIIWAFVAFVLLAPITGATIEVIKRPTPLWIVNLLVAFALITRSGFITGIQAKINEHKHSIVVAVMAMLYSLLWRAKTPAWFWFLYILFMIPFALIGSQYAIKNNFKRYNKGVQSDAGQAGAADA